MIQLQKTTWEVAVKYGESFKRAAMHVVRILRAVALLNRRHCDWPNFRYVRGDGAVKKARNNPRPKIRSVVSANLASGLDDVVSHRVAH